MDKGALQRHAFPQSYLTNELPGSHAMRSCYLYAILTYARYRKIYLNLIIDFLVEIFCSIYACDSIGIC